MDFLYNSLGVLYMNPIQRAISIIEKLPSEKLYAALYLLELIAAGEIKTDSEDILALKTFEMSCEEEELTPDEIARIQEGEAELRSGLGVKAEDVWEEVGL
ncbi:MAG: hypothetical protein RJR37_00795 [Peptococcaceae bacterium MAG4]|nr:hypothetical protein [Peptococcaceae bacterium MAG4]